MESRSVPQGSRAHATNASPSLLTHERLWVPANETMQPSYALMPWKPCAHHTRLHSCAQDFQGINAYEGCIVLFAGTRSRSCVSKLGLAFVAWTRSPFGKKRLSISYHQWKSLCRRASPVSSKPDPLPSRKPTTCSLTLWSGADPLIVPRQSLAARLNSGSVSRWSVSQCSQSVPLLVHSRFHTSVCFYLLARPWTVPWPPRAGSIIRTPSMTITIGMTSSG